MGTQRTFYGTELLNANEQLRREKEGKRLVINKSTGDKTEVILGKGSPICISLFSRLHSVISLRLGK
jgi:hypothetical protein